MVAAKKELRFVKRDFGVQQRTRANPSVLPWPRVRKRRKVSCSFLEHMLIGFKVYKASVERRFTTSRKKRAFFLDRSFIDALAKTIRMILSSLPTDSDRIMLVTYPNGICPVQEGTAEATSDIFLQKKWLFPVLQENQDDEQYASTALSKCCCTSAGKERVGASWRARCQEQYRSDPREYQRLVIVNDADGVMKIHSYQSKVEGDGNWKGDRLKARPRM